MCFTARATLVMGCAILSQMGIAFSPLPAKAQTYPAYNHVYGIATHNSYWMNRSDQTDFYSSGTQEILTDQLLHEHVRAIEIDVHSEGAPAHEWKVYHTSDSEDFSCRYLSDCLEFLRVFHYAVPKHEVVNVIVELKNTVPFTGADALGIHVNFNFAADHTMQDFDQIFRKTLGNSLYTPRDFLARCVPRTTMRECARRKGWPTIDQLRGKFIINIIGNWSTAAYDWAQYAGQNVQDRVAFPVQSVFDLFPQGCHDVVGGYDPPAATRIDLTNGGGTICVRDIDDTVDPSPQIDYALRQAAFDASVFWQLEDLMSPALAISAQFLKDNGVVRGRDSFEYGADCLRAPWNCQEQRIRAGFQLIQTDYPWHFVNDISWPRLHIPIDPSQRLKDPASLLDASGNVRTHETFQEPGSRIYFQTGPQWPGIWAYAVVPAISERWLEAVVSSTRHGDTWGETTTLLTLDDYIRTCPPSSNPEKECTNYPRQALEDGEGCIKVMSDSEADGMEICRQKNTTPGPSYYQESVDLYIRVYRAGTKVTDREFRAARYGPCKRQSDPNSDGISDACIGSLIALAAKNDGRSSQVSVYSAGKLGSSIPEWHRLGIENFGVPMTKQGYRGWKSELFAGLRTADKLRPMFVGPPPGTRPGPPGTIGPPSGVRTEDWLPDFARLHEIGLADLPNREVAGSDPNSRVVDLSYPRRVTTLLHPTLQEPH